MLSGTVAVDMLDRLHRRIFGVPMGAEMHQFVKNFGLILISGGLYGISFLLVNLFGARLLGPEQYGQYQLGLALVNVFVIILSLSGAPATMKLLRQHQNDTSKVVTSVLGTTLFSVAVIGLLFVFVNPLAALLSIPPRIWFLSIGTAAALGFYLIAKSFLQGMGKFGTYVVAEVIPGVVLASAFLLAFFPLADRSAATLLIVLGMGYISGFFVVLVALRALLRHPSTTYVRPYLNMVKYTLLLSIAAAVFNNVDRFFLNIFHGPAELGRAGAYLFSGMLLFGPLTQIFTAAFFPSAAQASPSATLAISGKLRRLLWLGFVTLLPAIFATGLLFRAFLGSGYLLDVSVLAIFSVAIFLSLFSGAQVSLLAASGHPRGLATSAVINIALAAWALTVGALLIKTLGIVGFGLNYGLLQVLMYILARREIIRYASNPSVPARP